jgi:ABC-type transport system involved in cytochrome c biogenesis ATPase subunit
VRGLSPPPTPKTPSGARAAVPPTPSPSSPLSRPPGHRIDLAVREGEILGFLGPNGAGRTTTLRMLTTLLAPTGGTASVADCDLVTDPVGARRACGYVAQSSGVDPNIGVREELITQGRLYRLTKDQAGARAEELTRELDFADLLGRKAGALSGGQRRRLDIATALITHHPRVLFLDEPTTGLRQSLRAPAAVVRDGDAGEHPAGGLMPPMTLAPRRLDVLSHVMPFRHLVDAVRDAYVGSYTTDHLLYGALVAVGLSVLAVTVGTRVFRTAGA